MLCTDLEHQISDMNANGMRAETQHRGNGGIALVILYQLQDFVLAGRELHVTRALCRSHHRVSLQDAPREVNAAINN